jgi:hypothetical protein
MKGVGNILGDPETSLGIPFNVGEKQLIFSEGFNDNFGQKMKNSKM